jgi:type I restriction-modification system DNA methylase subunit
MALSWNEIKDRALKFSKEWADESREHAEAKSFWDDFFNVFGITRRRVATFEEPVKKLNDKYGFIDLFWKGILLVEHKSKGKDLVKAYSQALDYFNGLKERELPKYVLVSDFERFRLYDLEEGSENEFHTKDFHKHIKLFGFIAGYQKRTYKEQDPVNIQAAELMGKLHDQLRESGYEGHPLEIYLVRLLFCLFADDTGIFEKDTFKEFVEIKTKEDGSDLGAVLAQYFQVLNTPNEKRLKTLDEHLNQFTYINGKLFEEHLPIAAFNSGMREILMECNALDWGKISPAIFGSLFQSVMNPQERRNLGAHYTSEGNILKLITPLFLDELHNEFRKAKGNKRKLQEFHKKLASLKFLDPACGCGNFLVITYRELRLLELEVLRELHKGGQRILNISEIIWIDVDQFYGIESEEWPARIAEVALWLMDHQMNLRVSEEFGQYFVRLPLRKSAKIVHGNSLKIEWEEVITKNELSYILGNPPFVGSKFQNKEQRAEITSVSSGTKGAGILDYVTGWYFLAARYIQGTDIQVAFVSTSSISQGEQVGALWKDMFSKNVKINFAHRTFQWNNEARGKAAVHCVIIGFSLKENKRKKIYEYDDVRSEPHEIKASNINAYLLDGPSVVIENRQKPLCNVPTVGIGNKPIDNGNYLFTPEEKEAFLKTEPKAAEYFRRWVGAREFLNGIERWCLWLGDCSPAALKSMPACLERAKKVQEYRSKSKSAPTRKLAATPTRFHVENIPTDHYLIIPGVSSERRKYIPIGFMTSDVFASNLVNISGNATLYHFGMLSSTMHMAWMRYTAGRLKSDYRYSIGLVYNNYPWPSEVSENQKTAVEKLAQAVLDARSAFPDSTLADLYDPISIPAKLTKAHEELDRAVDKCYRSQPFTNETTRIEFLFDLYSQYTAGLFATRKKLRK